jgi:hypothetical protein
MNTLATLVSIVCSDTANYQTKLKAVDEIGKKIANIGKITGPKKRATHKKIPNAPKRAIMGKIT